MTVINSNISALRAQSSLTANSKNLNVSMERLSTGVRINSAKDDAAGLAISNRMTSDIRGLAVAIRNANDGISLAQTAESAIGEVTNILQRMRELAVQSANGTLSNENRAAMQVEFSQLTAQIDNIASGTNFNGIKLLDGSSKDLDLQTGVREGDTVTLQLQRTDSMSLGLQGAATPGKLNSGRVGTNVGSGASPTIGATDIKINGYDWTTSAGATSVGGKTADYASAFASAINLNTGAHRVQASATNNLTSVAPNVTSFAAGDITVNGKTIGAAGSLADLVSNINRDAFGVTATLNSDQTITLSNNTGNDITIAGTAPTNAGFTAGTYQGFLSLSSLDAKNIELLSNNTLNGFASNVGLPSDVQILGFNEVRPNQDIQSKAVGSALITQADDIRINGIRIGVSDDGSALAKAKAINAISQTTGVTAEASTSVAITLDLTRPGEEFAASNPLEITIGGKVIDFTTAGPGSGPVKNVADVVSSINAAGINGVTASADVTGRLILNSTTGSDIGLLDASTAGSKFFTKYSEPDSSSDTTMPQTAITIKGRLTLRSQTGGVIRIEDYNTSQTVATKLGLSTQNLGSKAAGSLSISDQSNAGVAITALDNALKTVNLQRANLGAMQNRLEAAVNSLTSSSNNMSAARSRVLDTDYGLETTALSKAQVIQQAATAMLAQANQQPQQILALIKQ